MPGFPQTNHAFDVLITEVMFDPVPAVGMGGYEYIELYNAGEDTVNLANWIWQVGSKSSMLTEYKLSPGACVLLLPPNIIPKQEIKFLNLNKWQILSNSGQYLALKEPDGMLIHFMEYSPGLYIDALKRDGGWSLDMICRTYPCSPSSWKPSLNPLGGTPGYLVANDCYDVDEEVRPLRCGYLDSLHGFLYLSNYLKPDTGIEELVFESAEVLINEWEFYNDRTNCVLFTISDPFLSESIIKLDISGVAESCGGQEIFPSSVSWTHPVQPDSSDILISEILFNPGSDGIEFIELYNDSGKPVDASKLIIATINEDGTVKNFSRSGDRSELFFPEEYLIVSTDRNWMQRIYPDMPLKNHSSRKDLPAFVNSGGRIRLLNSDQLLLDEIQYDPDWHNQRIEDHSGVSLERLSFSVSGKLRDNWFSSASPNDFATPGYENSQIACDTIIKDHAIWLQNSVFSPDQDGVEDMAIVHFIMNQIGFSGQLEVRNPAGLLIREIQNWNLLPARGQFYWDGLDGDSRLVDSGLYILLFNFRHPDGSGGRWKKAVAVRNY